MKFEKIQNIDPNNEQTWRNRLFLTFDIDWAHDDLINESIDLVERHSVSATWFITHKTKVLDRLRENPSFELGIHPNFNPISELHAEKPKSNVEIIENLLEIVPEAKSVRSHSMHQSSRLQDLFKTMGLTHEANHFVPEQSGIVLKPWSLWNGLIKVPHFWEDDITALYGTFENFVELRKRDGLCVYDFHPIHVSTNMHLIQDYEKIKHIQREPARLRLERNTSNLGSRDALNTLLSWSKEQ